MQIPPELTAFLISESVPLHKRQTQGIGSTFNNNRSRIPFIIAFAIGVPIVLAIAGLTWWSRTKRRRAHASAIQNQPSRGNQSWGKRRTRNVRQSGGGRRGNNIDSIEPPPPVYTGTVSNANKNLPNTLTPTAETPIQEVGGSSRDAPPSYYDATAMEDGRRGV